MKSVLISLLLLCGAAQAQVAIPTGTVLPGSRSGRVHIQGGSGLLPQVIALSD